VKRRAHIAGTAYDGGYAAPHGCFYDGVQGVELGALGGIGSTALAINDGDHIAGYVTTVDSYDRAFHFTGGVMTDLGTLGGHYSYGIGINNSNVIVGGSFLDASDNVLRAFVYMDNRMQDMHSLLDESGAGWVLTEARAINDKGQIVGTGT